MFRYPNRLLNMFRKSSIARWGELAPKGDTSGGFVRFFEFDTPKEVTLRAQLSSTDVWIAQEKVHGANFGVHVFNEGREIRYAKRSGFVHDLEFFFGFRKLVPLFEHQMPIILSELKQRFGTIEGFIVNGELFGGKYQHPDLDPKPVYVDVGNGRRKRISTVQPDPFPQYSPDIHFFAFDLKYRENEHGNWIIPTPLEIADIFSKVEGLVYGKVLVKGTLAECLAFDMDAFETPIPHILGLGHYTMPNNFSEGLVVRHAQRAGEAETLTKNTILKFKHKMFQETRHSTKIGQNDARQALFEELSAKNGETLLIPSGFLTPAEVHGLEKLRAIVSPDLLQDVLSSAEFDAVTFGSSEKTESVDGTVKSRTDLVQAVALEAMKRWLPLATPDELQFNQFVRRHYANYVRVDAIKIINPRWKAIVGGQKTF